MAKHIISETDGSWKDKNWLTNLANDTTLATNLTEDYANDMLEAVADDTYPTLEEAVADLKDRIGLTASEADDIKKAAVKIVKHAGTCHCEELKMKKDMAETIPGNKEEVPGDRLVKESPEAVASMTPDVTAKGMNPGFQAYLDKKKEEREKMNPGKDKDEKKEDKDEKKEDKKESSYKSRILKKSWFQGSDEKVEKVVSNNPETLGKTPASGEVKYDKKPMETTAPKGEDTRPWEQDWFEGAAKTTKPDLGPAGEELTLKKKLQRARLTLKGLKK